MRKIRHRGTTRRVIPGLAMLPMLAVIAPIGCATSSPSSREALADADFVLRETLEEGSAAFGAQKELEAAQRKLGEARIAARDGRGELAIRLAEQVVVDARLAAALGAKARAEKKLGDARRLNRALQPEAKPGSDE